MSKPYCFRGSTSDKPLGLLATNMVELLKRMETLELMIINLNSRMSKVEQQPKGEVRQ